MPTSTTITPANLTTFHWMNFAAPAVVDITAGDNVTVSGHVPKDVTFSITGDASNFDFSDASLTLTDPTHFKGTIDLNEFGHVLLQGIAADSYSITGDVLSLFAGNTVLDKLTVVDGAPFAYFIGGRNSGSVFLDSGRISPGEGAFSSLPVHT
jgi:hypothetical protein